MFRRTELLRSESGTDEVSHRYPQRRHFAQTGESECLPGGGEAKAEANHCGEVQVDADRQSKASRTTALERKPYQGQFCADALLVLTSGRKWLAELVVAIEQGTETEDGGQERRKVALCTSSSRGVQCPGSLEPKDSALCIQ